MKHETIEEAAIKYATETNGVIVNQRKKQQFIAGAKYQAERMYSKEEVVAIVFNTMDYNLTPDCIEQFFLEHLKKK